MGANGLNRRQFLGLAAAGAGGLLLQQGLSRFGNTAQDHNEHGVTLLQAGNNGAAAFASPAVARFQVSLPIPSVLQPTSSDATTDYYTIHAQSVSQEILPGLQTPLYTYGGVFPAKTIEARRGRPIKVKVYNDLPVGQSISCHYHGGITPPQHDGYAEDITLSGVKLPTLIRPSASWEYVYPNEQQACTNWFHDHALHQTAQHVYRGLAGFYLVRDDEEESFNLPQGPYEIPLVFQDRIFDSNGELVYNNNDHAGVEGDVQLVNGAPWPRLQVAARKYRFRLLNGSNWRRYNLQFSNKLPFRQVGTESGFLRAPVNQQMIRMYPAERNDVVVDFSKVAVGTTIYLTNISKESKGTPMQQMMAFEVVRTESDDSQVPSVLANYENLTTPEAVSRSVITRTFVFERTKGMYAINGKFWNAKRFDARPRLGTTEIWRLVNNSGGWFHPVHIHLVNFQILDRKIDGKISTALPWERGRKDVVPIPENEEARVVIKWDQAEYLNYTGPYMMHCHNIDHEDHDMMTQFEVLPAA